jgi:UDP-N-acetylmuramoyl-tripeptide--D-alanyl-D-alanine ligase
MAELGARAGDEHRAIADLAQRLGVDLVAVATDAYGVPALADVDAAAAALGGILRPGDAVLVKASRVAGLERVAALLGA